MFYAASLTLVPQDPAINKLLASVENFLLDLGKLLKKQQSNTNQMSIG